jgi:acyl-CoA thioester hydrolase
MRGRNECRLRADLAERSHDVGGPLAGAALALEDEDAHGFVDRGKMPVQDLLGLVRLRGDVRTLSQLQRGFLRGRPVAPGADDDDALPVPAVERIGQRILDREAEPADVPAAKRFEGRHGARVGRRMAVALFHGGSSHDDVVSEVGQRAFVLPGHQPDEPVERLGCFDGQTGPAFVAHDNEQVGFGRAEHNVQRLQRLSARLRGMERRPAAREDDSPGGQAPLADPLGNTPKPFRLRADRVPGQFSGHRECDGTIRPVQGFRSVHTQEVAFRDLDAFGHVNNAVYLTYLENARVTYLRDVLGVDSLSSLLVIVASVQIDFRSRASLGDVLEVGSRVSRVGGKAFDLDHEIRGPGGRLVAEAHTVLVAFDYEQDGPMDVPAEWRERIEDFEARSFAAA